MAGAPDGQQELRQAEVPVVSVAVDHFRQAKLYGVIEFFHGTVRSGVMRGGVMVINVAFVHEVAELALKLISVVRDNLMRAAVAADQLTPDPLLDSQGGLVRKGTGLHPLPGGLYGYDGVEVATARLGKGAHEVNVPAVEECQDRDRMILPRRNKLLPVDKLACLTFRQHSRDSVGDIVPVVLALQEVSHMLETKVPCCFMSLLGERHAVFDRWHNADAVSSIGLAAKLSVLEIKAASPVPDTSLLLLGLAIRIGALAQKVVDVSVQSNIQDRPRVRTDAITDAAEPVQGQRSVLMKTSDSVVAELATRAADEVLGWVESIAQSAVLRTGEVVCHR